MNVPFYPCPESGCSYIAMSDDALNGHIGSAHVRVRALKPIPHGTPAGYRGHRRRDEKACAECLRAWRKKYQKSL